MTCIKNEIPNPRLMIRAAWGPDLYYFDYIAKGTHGLYTRRNGKIPGSKEENAI
jgi:hypothetical protein